MRRTTALLAIGTLSAAALAFDARASRPVQLRRVSPACRRPPRASARLLAGDGDGAAGAAAAEESAARTFVREQLLQGVEPSPNLVAILVVYFVQGGLGLASLATTLYFKDELGLSAAQLGALSGVFTAPWIFKPLYGFVTDSYRLFGSRRRAYLAVAGLGASAAYAALATGLPTTSATATAVVVGSLAVAVSDVVADAMVVENARALAGGRAVEAGAGGVGAAESGGAEGGAAASAGAEAGAEAAAAAEAEAEAALSGTLQSLCWGSRAVGSIVSSYASGAAVSALGVTTVFGLTSLLPLTVVLAALCMDEDRVEAAPGGVQAARAPDAASPARADGAPPSRAAGAAVGSPPDASPAEVAAAQFGALWSALRQPSIWQPALFIFGWLAMPSSDSAFLFFMTDDLKLSAEFLGRIQFVGSLASLSAIVAYQRLLREVPVSRVLVGCTLASAAFGSVQLALATHANRALGIPDGLLALGDDAVLTALSELAHMPVLVLAARLCPPGVEGALFATLMSVYNAGGTVGRELGAALTASLGVGTDGDFAQLPELLVICSAAKLLPLPFLKVLDQVGAPPLEPEDGGPGAPRAAPLEGAAERSADALAAAEAVAAAAERRQP